jgi:hypothetical protein
MFHLVVGPFLFAAGLALIFVAVHGLPKAPASFGKAQDRLGSLTRFRRAHRSRPTTVTAFTQGDTLVGEMLSEMMTLREQLAELQEQVGSLKPRGRSRKATAA